MLTITKCLLLTMITLVSQGAVQDDPQSVKRLVGTERKEWVYESFSAFISGRGGCASGESWVFHKDGKVEVKKCVDRKTVVTERRWTLRRKSQLDVVVTIDGTEYLVLFPSTPKPKEKMILRTKSDAKTTATKDLVFSR